MISGGLYYFHIWIYYLTLSFKLLGIPFYKFQQVPSEIQRAIATNVPLIDKRIAVRQKKAEEELS